MFKKAFLYLPIFFLALILVLTFKTAQAASLSLSPSSGKVDSQFTISGSSFTSDLPAVANWDDSSILTNGTIDGSGNFFGTGKVPSGASVGAHTVSLTAAQPAMNKPWWQIILPRALAFVPFDYATATFTVTEDNPDTPTPSTTSSDTPTSKSTSSSDSKSSSSDSLNGSASQNPETGSADASQLDRNKSKITVDKTECLANGQDKITINLSLVDSQGKAITGLKPEITVSGSNNSLSKIEYKNSLYISELSSTSTEEKNISAKIGNTQLNSVKVNFSNKLISSSPTASNKAGSSTQTKKSFWASWWWLILLMILIILAALAYLYYRYKKARRDIQETQKTPKNP